MSSIPLCLYAVRAGQTEMVKIGVSRNPRRRMIQLQTDTPYRLDVIFFIELGNIQDGEQRVHAAFVNRHSHGEWFSIPTDDEVWDVVESVLGTLEWSDTIRHHLPTETARSSQKRQAWINSRIRP